MIRIRSRAKNQSIQKAQIESFHAFSYGTKIDFNWMHFHALKVFCIHQVSPQTQFNITCTNQSLQIKPLLDSVDLLCKSHGKTTIPLEETFSLSMEEESSLTLKNSSESDNKILHLESLSPLNVEREILAGNQAKKLLLQSKPFWIFVLEGECQLNENSLVAGDSVAIEGEKEITLNSTSSCEVIYFEVPTS